MCANVQTFYVRATVKPGDSVPYGDLQTTEIVTGYEYPDGVHRMSHYSEQGTPLTVIRYTECGDYSSNALVGESNRRVLHERFPWLVEVYGSHGYRALGYLGKRETQNPELIEALDALDEYPLADEDDHSELQTETEHEQWCDHGRDDFKRALVAYFNETYAPDEHDLDDVGFDVQVDSLWCALVDRLQGGEGAINEQGDSMYFLIDPVMKKIRASWPGMSRNGYDGSPSLDWMLIRLAESCTV